MKFYKLFILPILALSLAGCKDKDNVDTQKKEEPVVEIIDSTFELASNEMTIMLDKGDVQIEYTLLKKGVVFFSSSDESIATVSSDGVLSPKNVGITNITVVRGKYSETIKVTVVEYRPDDALSFKLSNDNINLLVNDVYVLNFECKYGNKSLNSDEVIFDFISYNNSLISVDGNEIKALNTGTCEILVSGSYNETINYYSFTITIH